MSKYLAAFFIPLVSVLIILSHLILFWPSPVETRKRWHRGWREGQDLHGRRATGKHLERAKDDHNQAPPYPPTCTIPPPPLPHIHCSPHIAKPPAVMGKKFDNENWWPARDSGSGGISGSNWRRRPMSPVALLFMPLSAIMVELISSDDEE